MNDASANQAFLEMALLALNRTSWGFSDQEREARNTVTTAITELRRAQRLVELMEAQ